MSLFRGCGGEPQRQALHAPNAPRRDHPACRQAKFPAPAPPPPPFSTPTNIPCHASRAREQVAGDLPAFAVMRLVQVADRPSVVSWMGGDATAVPSVEQGVDGRPTTGRGERPNSSRARRPVGSPPAPWSPSSGGGVVGAPPRAVAVAAKENKLPRQMQTETAHEGGSTGKMAASSIASKNHLSRHPPSPPPSVTCPSRSAHS